MIQPDFANDDPEALDSGELRDTAERRRVLIVDDDLDFLAVAQATLAAYGFEVEQATGGLRAVFLATRIVPDAVLCDLRMPGIDGFVVAEALRNDPATATVAIVACTGRRDLESKVAGAESPFDAVFVKPVDWDALVDALDAAIDARSRRAGPLGPG